MAKEVKGSDWRWYHVVILVAILAGGAVALARAVVELGTNRQHPNSVGAEDFVTCYSSFGPVYEGRVTGLKRTRFGDVKFHDLALGKDLLLTNSACVIVVGGLEDVKEQMRNEQP